MHFVVFFFLIEVIVNNFIPWHYNAHAEKAVETEEGYCKILVALLPQGYLAPTPSTPESHSQNIAVASFERHHLHWPHQGQDGGSDQGALEVPLLQAAQQDACQSLWPLRQDLASMSGPHIHPWCKEARDLELFRQVLGSSSQIFQVTTECQAATFIYSEIEREKDRQAGKLDARFRPTMEFETASINAYHISHCSREQCRSSSSCPAANLGKQTSDQGSAALPTRDSADHCRVHEHQGDLQKHASGRQEGRQCSCQVQGSQGSPNEAAQLLDGLCGREHQKMENLCGGLHEEGCCIRERTPRSQGATPDSKNAPGRSEGKAPSTRCSRPRRDGSNLRWRERRGPDEGRHCRDHPKEDSHGRGQPRKDSAGHHRGERHQQRGQGCGSQKTKARCAFWSWLACTLRAGQVAFSEACPRHSDEPCLQNMIVDIWNHGIITEDIFVNPWKASMQAVDLAHEVGTLRSSSTTTTLPCQKRHFAGTVRFSNSVDLLVGLETELCMSRWPLALEVPHQQASVLRHHAPLPVSRHKRQYFEAKAGKRIDEAVDDEVSLLAAPLIQPGAPMLPQLQHQPPDALMEDRNIARDPADLTPASSDDSPAATPSSQMPEDWYSTLIYTIEGGPTPVWLDWNDYYGLHQRAAQVLQVRFDDLYVMHWIQTPPQDTARAGTASVIAHRRGDLSTGSLERFVLLDVEFHSARLLENPEVVHKVRLIPDQLSRQQVLRALGLLPVCERASNRCLLWVNDELIPLGASRIYVNDGDYMRIAIPPGSSNVDHIATRCLASAYHQGMTVEEISMRHTLYRLGWYDEPIGPPHVPRHRGFHELLDGDEALYLQLYATTLPPLEKRPAFLSDDSCAITHEVTPEDRLEDEPPYRQEVIQHDLERQIDPLQALQAQPAAIQELHMHWTARIAQLEAADRNDDPAIDIQTWFLAMPNFLNCNEPRTVRLHQQFELWLRNIAETWYDQLDPHWPIHLFLVRPLPPATLLERDQKIHVIVVQQPPLDGVANLFSIVATHNTIEPMRHFARFAPAQVTKPQVLGFAGLGDVCYPELSPLQCMVWHGDLEIRDRLALRNRNGVSFLIIIQELPYLPVSNSGMTHGNPWEAESDETPLIQVRGGQPWERLTTDAVAHAQWPQEELQHRRSAPPRRISLDPLTSHEDPSIYVPCGEVRRLAQQLFYLDLGPSLPFESVVKWHDSTIAARSTCPDWHGSPPLKFWFYTDGASCYISDAGRRFASAAVVLLVDTAEGLRFGGFRPFRVPVPATAPFAEHVAMLIAHLWCLYMHEWCLTMFGYWNVPVTFAFDCIAAGHAALGTWICPQHQSVHRLTQSLTYWIQARYDCQHSYVHVRSHQGDAWNEAADAACWAALHEWIPAPDFAELFSQHLEPHLCAAEWLGYWHYASMGAIGYPFIKNDCFVYRLPINASMPDASSHTLVQRDSEVLKLRLRTLKCCCDAPRPMSSLFIPHSMQLEGLCRPVTRL